MTFKEKQTKQKALLYNFIFACRFIVKSFPSPYKCNYCTSLLVGLQRQGITCECELKKYSSSIDGHQRLASGWMSSVLWFTPFFHIIFLSLLFRNLFLVALDAFSHHSLEKALRWLLWLIVYIHLLTWWLVTASQHWD